MQNENLSQFSSDIKLHKIPWLVSLAFFPTVVLLLITILSIMQEKKIFGMICIIWEEIILKKSMLSHEKMGIVNIVNQVWENFWDGKTNTIL